MDRSNMIDANEFSVNEGAFWHTNMDLYYGYQPGEVVEVEHESNKYWLASIQYSFRHLILLKWVGNYGEFWVDTSLQNYSTTSSSADVFNTPKRLFPPGYHLQSQLKSLFTLERPTKVLVKPSLYNPANDPYAEVRTVDDLLSLEVSANNDAFANQTSSSNSNELASAVLAKCKTKISYSQEDVDELDAALQNLNEIDSDQANGVKSESPDIFNNNNSSTGNSEQALATAADEKKIDDDADADADDVTLTISETDGSDSTTKIQDTNPCEPVVVKEGQPDQESGETKSQSGGEKPQPASETSEKCNEIKRQSAEPIMDHDANKEECLAIQNMAINLGQYFSTDENNKKVYHMKPKQFFDVGGANQERVLVPGTLLEIAHAHNKETGLELYHWFAVILKNVGGRLTLRWFFCDEPKFKQGRLELKSCRSEFIREEEDQENSGDNKDDDRCGLVQKTKILAKEITFSMHFCDPCVHSISHAKSIQRAYKMPVQMVDFIEDNKGVEIANSIEQAQMEHVFDFRRTNLDKDRPIIDHLLATVRSTKPQYVKVTFAPYDNHSRREILLSTPKTTKLLRGFVKRELEPGVFEVHSEQISDNGEVIKFIYPYNSSYSILPTNWAVHNEDCLSVQPSRNPTPIPATVEGNQQTSAVGSDQDSGVGQTENFQEIEHEEEQSDHQLCIDESKPESPRNLSNQIPTILAIDTNGIAQELIEDKPSARTEETMPKINPDEQTEADKSQLFDCSLDCSQMDEIVTKFRVMDQLEVVHPSSDTTICLGRIRKVVYPLLWIQISADSYTLLPFNSTEIYPIRWCETNNHSLVSLLPPRKRPNQAASSQVDKKRKKTKNSEEAIEQQLHVADGQRYEHFDLGALNDKQLDLDCILNEKSMYIRIYFNHKCFTGPSLSKGKICSLPQYVGPGPLRLVMEEVLTKIISVAYVPPRILNDLSSKLFEDLLIARNLTNTTPMEFKAKYQKRVHREDIPVCLSPDDVALYCECICEHLKCCYNLFGPNLYDGDDCPGHCRALTKSNKFMKRATYYREKARLGEFLNDNSNKKLTSSTNNAASKTSRASYAGRDSSESTSSSNAYDAPIGDWTVEDVADHLEKSQLGKFKRLMTSEGVDGQALLLLDKAAIREHFQHQPKSKYTQEELTRLCMFVEFARSRAGTTAGI